MLSSSKRHMTAVVNSKRHFTAVVNSKEHGLYISSSPSSAARKIVSKLCNVNKNKKVEFHVREITQGSKKKTYGPYLGEMKKLAKPIELKGRIIRYATEVHLKKKKNSTAKSLKKTSKKMRGGFIESKGYLSYNDFEIDYYDCYHPMIPLDNYGLNGYGYLFNKVELMNYLAKIPDCFLRTVSQTGKKYIFFKKNIYNFNDPDNILYQDTTTIIVKNLIKSNYKYVVFVEKRFLQNYEVIFKVYDKIDNFPKVLISTISILALKQLIRYLRINQRLFDESFFRVIYDEVERQIQISEPIIIPNQQRILNYDPEQQLIQEQRIQEQLLREQLNYLDSGYKTQQKQIQRNGSVLAVA